MFHSYRVCSRAANHYYFEGWVRVDGSEVVLLLERKHEPE